MKKIKLLTEKKVNESPKKFFLIEITKSKFMFILLLIIAIIFITLFPLYSENIISIDWVLVPPGKFYMGTPNSVLSFSNEQPIHSIYLKEFYISKFEITCEQYSVFCIETKRKFPDSIENMIKIPITNVSWYDAVEFCQWLSKKLKKNISLPTEAQWEKACRGGTSGDTYMYSDREIVVNKKEEDPFLLLSSFEWVSYNANEEIHPVGKLKPNPYGIYDMLGNVSEWCYDIYDENYYKISSKINPAGPGKSTNDPRVIRGGNINTEFNDIRCAYRGFGGPSIRSSDLGFRIIMNENPEPISRNKK